MACVWTNLRVEWLLLRREMAEDCQHNEQYQARVRENFSTFAEKQVIEQNLRVAIGEVWVQTRVRNDNTMLVQRTVNRSERRSRRAIRKTIGTMREPATAGMSRNIRMGVVGRYSSPISMNGWLPCRTQHTGARGG